MPDLPARDAAFAALLLLKSPSRAQAIVACLVEERRSDVASALQQFEGMPKEQLERTLSRLVRQERGAMEELMSRDFPGVSRGLRKFLAFSALV